MSDNPEINKVKRYERIRSLGEGAFATVHLANDLKLNRKVAVKVFKHSDSEEQLVRFNREIEICKHLRHPNVVKIYDATISKDKPRVIMEYIEGQSLLELITGSVLKISDILSIAEQVGKALGYLHSQGILHRDIKPANVMVEKELRAILMDFNLASSVDLTMITREGYVVGSPRYMAPELLKGYPSTELSDIYSLGIVLLDMLTTLAVPSEDLMTSAKEFKGIKPPSHYNPSVPECLDLLVLSMTSVDQAMRCQNMEDFQTGLEKVRAELRSEEKYLSRRAKHQIISEEVIESDGKDTKKVQPIRIRVKKKRFLAIGVFLLVTGAIILTALDKFIFTLFQSTGIAQESETEKKLISLSVKCNSPLVAYDDLLAFIKIEEGLERNIRDKNDRSNHCEILKKIVARTPINSPLRLYFEYLYRMRQMPLKTTADKDSIDALLSKAADRYFDNLTKISVTDNSQITTAQFFFKGLVSENRTDSAVMDELIRKATLYYHSFSPEIKDCKEGKALLHTIALVELNGAGKNSIDKIFLCKASYENDLLSETRKLLGSELFSSGLDKEKEIFITRINSFLEKAIVEQLELKEQRDENVRKTNYADPLFLQKQTDGEEKLFLQYNDLVKKYASNLKRAWYMLRLDESSESWAVPVSRAAMGCYSSFKFKSSVFISKGMYAKYGPGSRAFALDYLPLWMDGIGSVSLKDEYFNPAFVISQFNNLLSWRNYFTDESNSPDLTPLINSIYKKDESTGFCLKILHASAGGNEKADYGECMKHYQNYMSKVPELNREKLKSWSIGISIISNRLLRDLKELQRYSERIERSLDLLNVLEKYSNKKNYKPEIHLYGYYFGPVILRQVALLHTVDAFLEDNRDFFKEQPDLARVLGVKKILEGQSESLENANLKSGVLASARLLKRETLSLSDIPVNPLNM